MSDSFQSLPAQPRAARAGLAWITAAMLAFGAAPAAFAQATPAGLWKAVDADSRKETSLVRIVDSGGVLTGRIEKLLDPALPAGKRCDQCDGDRRGKPLVGLEIIRKASHDAADPALWSGGEILDPENGKSYSLQLKPVDGGTKLEVRGYIGTPVLGRTQTWIRVDESGMAVAAPTPAMQAAPATLARSEAAPAGRTAAANGPQPTPVGLWKAIDSDTNKETSVVRIVDRAGVLTGRIEKMLDPSIPAGKGCDQCVDDRRGKPLVGLDVIRAAKRDAADAALWSGGEVLDPENGKTYSLLLKPIDEGRKLEVRGYIGTPALGRTQTWVRIDEPGMAMAAPAPVPAPAQAQAPTPGPPSPAPPVVRSEPVPAALTPAANGTPSGVAAERGTAAKAVAETGTVGAVATVPAAGSRTAARSDTATPPTPVGLWKAIDSDTNKETSVVRISDRAGVLTGRIEKLLDPSIPAGKGCDECVDDRRGKPLVGLDVIRAAKRDAADAALWSGGEILDPANGKTYNLLLKPIDDGRKLEVRGYIGAPMLGRTQTWVRMD